MDAFVALFAFSGAAASLREATTLPAPGATLARTVSTLALGFWELRAGLIIADLDSCASAGSLTRARAVTCGTPPSAALHAGARHDP